MKENKEEVRQLIEERMSHNDSPLYVALNNLKTKLFEKKNKWKNLNKYGMELKLGLI